MSLHQKDEEVKERRTAPKHEIMIQMTIIKTKENQSIKGVDIIVTMRKKKRKIVKQRDDIEREKEKGKKIKNRVKENQKIEKILKRTSIKAIGLRFKMKPLKRKERAKGETIKDERKVLQILMTMMSRILATLIAILILTKVDLSLSLSLSPSVMNQKGKCRVLRQHLFLEHHGH